jgi:hypothetical protein
MQSCVIDGIRRGDTLAGIANQLGVSRQRVQQAARALTVNGVLIRNGYGDYSISPEFEQAPVSRNSREPYGYTISVTLPGMTHGKLRTLEYETGRSISEIITGLVNNYFQEWFIKWRDNH